MHRFYAELETDESHQDQPFQAPRDYKPCTQIILKQESQLP